MFEKIYEVKDANAEEVTSGDDVKFEGDGYAEDKAKIVEAQTLKALDGSDDEFLDFLINLPNYPERHNFSESLVEKILRRSFVLMTLEEGGIEDVDQKVLFKVIEALEVHLDFTRTEEFSGESLKDKAFKIFLEMYKELPPLVQDSFFDQLMQNPQTLRKDILLSGIKFNFG